VRKWYRSWRVNRLARTLAKAALTLDAAMTRAGMSRQQKRVFLRKCVSGSSTFADVFTAATK
jgi:histidinol-phosphate/aromatic aminotransferase/cobyric acid decarboxylase-like protein